MRQIFRILAVVAVFFGSHAFAQVPPGNHYLLDSMIAQTKLRSGQFGSQGLIIAHRGVYHRTRTHTVYDRGPVPENSVIAAVWAVNDFGIQAIEVDVRLSADSVPFVIHDYVLNRSTVIDGRGGDLNIQLVKNQLAAGNISTATADTWLTPIFVNSRTAAMLAGTQLKAYGTNSQLLRGAAKLQPLEIFLRDVIKDHDGIHPPLVILDLQDPQVTKKAAEVVRKLNFQGKVLLKFFANRAVADLGNIGLQNGANDTIDNWCRSCYYAIQFNNGEISPVIDEFSNTTVGRIRKFGVNSDVVSYAEAFIKTGRVVAISMSLPANGQTPYATYAILGLERYIHLPGKFMPTMGIISAPDQAYRDAAGACHLYSFAANPDAGGHLTTNSFNYANLTDRNEFGRRQRFTIADVVPWFDRDPQGRLRGRISIEGVDFIDILCGR